MRANDDLIFNNWLLHLGNGEIELQKIYHKMLLKFLGIVLCMEVILLIKFSILTV